MSEAVARVEEASVVLGGRLVLGPLSVTLGAGEHWALIGPNGSGKTTLLSLLGAERHPSSGRVEVLGERLGTVDLRALRTRIGVVSHRIAERLPPGASALEIVLTGKDSLLAPWWGSFDEADRATAGELLALVGLAGLAEQPFARCSQGERQRVLLARSLLGGHELLLLDEPAVGVDLPGREALIATLDGLADLDGPATVQVAHTLEELPTSTSHALLLRSGAVVAAGPAEEVLTSEALSACFSGPFVVEVRDGRYSARAEGSWRPGGG